MRRVTENAISGRLQVMVLQLKDCVHGVSGLETLTNSLRNLIKDLVLGQIFGSIQAAEKGHDI
jgi:hypothetical protein